MDVRGRQISMNSCGQITEKGSEMVTFCLIDCRFQRAVMECIVLDFRSTDKWLPHSWRSISSTGKTMLILGWIYRLGTVPIPKKWSMPDLQRIIRSEERRVGKEC